MTDDAVLGGRLRLLQKRRGHRVGHDAILLAAATDARPGDRVIDLGAGIGAAGLAVAARVPDVDVTLEEIDPELRQQLRFHPVKHVEEVFEQALVGWTRVEPAKPPRPRRK